MHSQTAAMHRMSAKAGGTVGERVMDGGGDLHRLGEDSGAQKGTVPEEAKIHLSPGLFANFIEHVFSNKT